MKVLYLIVGLIGIALGAVGAVMPLLPATPFLCLATYCFAKSSRRLDTWFKSTKLYQKNLESFVSGRGMTVGTKVRILSTVTVMLVFAAYCMRHVPYGFAIIGVVWVIHLVAFLGFIKTAEESES